MARGQGSGARGNSARGGFTLAECLVASVVLAVAVMGVCSAIVAAQKQLDSQEEDTTAIALGRQLMEEAASRPLTLTDGTSGWPVVTNRSSYDTIGDYSGYTDTVNVPIRRSATPADAGTFSSASPTVTVVTGSAPDPQKQTYLRKVTITYPTTMFGSAVTQGDFAIVTVTVTGGGGNGTTLTRLIARNTIQR